MNHIDNITENFDLKRTHIYSISIQQSLDGYTFYVTDPTLPASQRTVAQQFTPHNPTTAANPLQSHPLLQHAYQAVHYYGIGPYALVPSHIAGPRDINAAMLPIPQALQNRAQILSTPITPQHTLLAYTNQWNLLSPTWHPHHIMEPLLSQAVHGLDATAVYAHIAPRQLNIVVKTDNQIHVANTFATETDTDILYYILASYQQFEHLQLSAETAPLHINGNMPETTEIEKYIQHIVHHEQFI